MKTRNKLSCFAVSLSLLMSGGTAYGGPVSLDTTLYTPDLNGDDRADIVIEDNATGFTVGRHLDGLGAATSGTVAGTNVGANFVTEAFPDLNGDGQSDKVVRSTDTGFSVGFITDTDGFATADSGPVAVTNAGFVTSGFPDLNGDGRADKVVEDTATGFAVAFITSASGLGFDSNGSIPGTNVGAGFSTAGYPDMNGDGNGDKVVEHSTGFSVVALMNGLTVIDQQPIAGTNVAAGFFTAGFPDLNGDGLADKVVESSVNGFSVGFITDTDGFSVANAGAVALTNPGFSTVGFPDLNGDGRADKVVEDDATGFTVAFITSVGGLGFDSNAAIPGTPAGSTSTFADINGDGNADKIVEDASGNVTAHLMDGTTVLDSGPLPTTNAGFTRIAWLEPWLP